MDAQNQNGITVTAPVNEPLSNKHSTHEWKLSTTSLLQPRVLLCRLEDFERWEKEFMRSVSDCTVKEALELDCLPHHSPLESCYYLGKMLEANYPLSKPQKGKDTVSKFPVLALSMISQRLLNLEKVRAQIAETNVELLRQRIKDLEAQLA